MAKYWKLLFSLSLLFLLASCSGGPVASSWPGVLVTKEAIYISNLTQIYSLNPANGVQNWVFPREGQSQTTFFANPALLSDQLLVGDYANILHSINPQNGTENWTFKEATGKWIAPPILDGETILAPCGDNFLYALDLKGNLKWKFETGHALWASPIAVNKIVYQPSMDHFLYALKVENGSLLWKVDLTGAVVSSPTYIDGRIYVSTLAKQVIILDSGTGKLIKKLDTDGAIWSSPIIEEGMIFVANERGKIYIFSSDKYNLVEEPYDLGSQIISSGVVTPDKKAVVFSSDIGKIVAINLKDRSKKDVPWKMSEGDSGKVYSPLNFSADNLVIPFSNGNKLVQTINLDGASIWTFSIK